MAGALHDQQHAPEPPLSTSPAGAPAPARVAAAVLTRSLPVELVIPSIGVRTGLLRLGLTPSGALQVPAPGPSYDEAGWYTGSPTPGVLGPAVIVGHVDSAVGGPSVFFRLGRLRPRARVSVRRADGSTAVFAVDRVLRFHKTAFPTQLVYGDTDHAALRLITCGGAFDHATGHYLDDVVVTASLVS